VLVEIVAERADGGISERRSAVRRRTGGAPGRIRTCGTRLRKPMEDLLSACSVRSGPAAIAQAGKMLHDCALVTDTNVTRGFTVPNVERDSFASTSQRVQPAV